VSEPGFVLPPVNPNLKPRGWKPPLSVRVRFWLRRLAYSLGAKF
jgi:hypothetical protein